MSGFFDGLFVFHPLNFSLSRCRLPILVEPGGMDPERSLSSDKKYEFFMGNAAASLVKYQV